MSTSIIKIKANYRYEKEHNIETYAKIYECRVSCLK